MADSEITDLVEFTGIISTGDYFVFVDRNDTTDSPEGTTKKIRSDKILYTLTPVSEPVNSSDMSVLPGGIVPSFGIFFANRAAGGFWMIKAGDSFWQAFVSI